MRRVIVNSTPLIALCNADLLNILKKYMVQSLFLKQYSTKLQQKGFCLFTNQTKS